MNKEVEKLIEEVRELYRTGAKTVETTKAEDRLWGAVKDLLPRPCPRANDWFKTYVDDKRYVATEIRLSLLAQNALILLEVLDTDKRVSPYAARKILVEAKIRRRDKGISLDDALAEALADFQRTGKVVESRMDRTINKSVDLDADIGSTKEFHAAIRTLTTNYIKQRLPDAEPGERNEAIEEFAAEMRTAFDALLRRVTKYSNDSFERKRISIGAVDKACDMLSIARQDGSDTVDMELARRQHRKLSIQLHPDRDAGNSDRRIVEQYTAVQDAWTLLQDYDRQIKNGQRMKAKTARKKKP